MMTTRADVFTTNKENPNLLILNTNRETGILEPKHLSYSLYDRLKEAALDFTAGLPCSDPKTFLKLVWDDFGMYDENPAINIEVWVRADNPKPDHLWRYVGDIAYARNWHTQDDNIFETHEIVDAPTKTDPHHTDMRIFGEFKSVRWALKDLLSNGNFSHNGRRGHKL